MRNLVLFLIAFIAIVTFIRAFEKIEAGTLNDLSGKTSVEVQLGN